MEMKAIDMDLAIHAVKTSPLIQFPGESAKEKKEKAK